MQIFADKENNLVEILLNEFPRKPKDSRNVADYSKNAHKHLQRNV